jgi:hypothetical protein
MSFFALYKYTTSIIKYMTGGVFEYELNAKGLFLPPFNFSFNREKVINRPMIWFQYCLLS